MNKIKITSNQQEVNTTLQQDAYVVRLENISGKLVARYFRVVKPEDVPGGILSQSLSTVDANTLLLMRQLVNSHTHFAGSVVTSNADLADHGMVEIGRHIFSPGVFGPAGVGSGEKYDFALYVLPFSGVDSIGEPYNHFVESAQIKGPVPRNSRMANKKPVFMLYSDNGSAVLGDWTLYFVQTSAFMLEDLTDGAWSTQSGFDSMGLLPSVEISAPSSIGPDSSGVVGVSLKRGSQTVPYTGDLVLESVSGYTPKTRLQISNGSGSFKVMSLGLESGDTLRVKVGTRCISGLADASIPVV